MIEEKIKDILVEQEKQLEVDAMLQVIEDDNLKPTEASIKSAKNQLISEKKDSYLSLEQKRRDENRKYTETCREEIKKEQERLLKERRDKRKIEKAITAYEKHKDEFEAVNPMRMQENKKSFIEKIKEFFLGNEKMQTKDTSKEVKTKTHKEFEQELKNVPNKEFKQEIEEKIAQREELSANEQNRRKNSNQTIR